jgi:hypothetical protein
MRAVEGARTFAPTILRNIGAGFDGSRIGVAGERERRSSGISEATRGY